MSDEQAAEEAFTQTTGCSLYNTFQGLSRSSLQCPNCSRSSNTFESYLCLSLPLPNKVMRSVYIILAEEIEPDKPIQQTKIGLRMNANGIVKDLRKEIAHITGISEKRVCLYIMNFLYF